METVDYLYFIIFSTVLALFVMFLMFLSSMLVGFIISKLISTFLLPKETYIRISSFQLSLLSGKLILKGMKIATKNTCLRVVEATITFRYWRPRTRQSLYVHDDSPSKLSIEFSGLEYLIYNNSYKYENIREILEKRKNFDLRDLGDLLNPERQGMNGGGNATDVEHSNASSLKENSLNGEGGTNPNAAESVPLPAVKDFVTPRFYKLFPATEFSIRKGCLMLSNPELPTILTMVFEKGNGVYTTDSANAPDLDYYRQIINLDLVKTKLSLITNTDYNGDDELFVERPQKEDFVTYAFESFKSIFKDIRFTFINTDLYETSDLPRRKNVNTAKGESSYDYGKHSEILHCNRTQIQYYCDIPGPVALNQSTLDNYSSTTTMNPHHHNLVFKENFAPQWGVDISFLSPCTLVYGPWADRNRNLLQRFFLPSDYQAQHVYKPILGEARQYACFNLQMNFAKGSTFRIPFRELSKDQSATAEEIQQRKYGWVDIKLDEESNINCISPLVASKESGFNMELNVLLKKCSIITSLTNTLFLSSNSLKLSCLVDSPLVWNQLTEWTMKLVLEEPQIFLLSDVITLFKDLGNDWSAGEPVGIHEFIPKRFTFEYSLLNFKLFCNVNEQNIINQPNNLNENAHYVFTGPELGGSLLLPFTTFQSPKTEITFNVAVRKVQLKLLLPVYNTIHQHLEDIQYFNDQSPEKSQDPPIPMNNDSTYIGDQYYQEVSGSSQFITSDRLELNGRYLYYQKVDPSYLNSIVLEITGYQPTVKLFGFYVRYFLFLKNNFFGYTSHIINLQKYKDNIQKEKEAKDQSEDSDLQEEEEENNDLEIYVSLKLIDATVFLPTGLYSSKQQATVALHEFLMEIRYLPDYLDLYADFSPLVINIPITDSEEAKNVDHSIDILNRYIQINDFTFKIHFLYGPKPSEANYADFINVNIGSVTGNVLISQITGLGLWFENFSFHLTNKDNGLSTKLVSKMNPVYSLLKLSVNTMSLYIYSSAHITEIRLAQGLKMHSNSLIDQLSHSKMVIEIPEISFKLLVPFYKYSSAAGANSANVKHVKINNKKWVEVGELSISTNLSIYEKLPNWKNDSIKQRQFLIAQDNKNRLLSFLWEDDDDLHYLYKQSCYEQDQLKAHSLHGKQNQSQSNLSNPPNVNLTPTRNPTLLTTRSFSPLSATSANNSGTPQSNQFTPISASKTNSFLYPKQLLKWTTNSPMGAYDLFAASTGKMKSSKSNLESFILDGSMDQSATIQDSNSDLSNDEDYQTPESSIKEENKDDSDTDEDINDDHLYKTTKSNILPNSSFISSNPLKASASTNNLKKILKDKNIDDDEQADDQQTSNQEKLLKEKNINPHILYLRSYLRSYYFNFTQARMAAFGSKSKQSSFVECSSTNKKNSFNHGMSSNPHESIHSISNEVESSFLNYISHDISPDKIPVQPKRSKSKKLIFPSDIDAEDEQNEEDCHDHDDDNTSITTIFIDSMKDIELFATPVIVYILEDLVESFIAKDPSIDYMLDYFQLDSISKQFKVKKFLHNQIKLNLFIHKFNLNWIQSLNQEMYSTEIVINSITTQLLLCSKQTNSPHKPALVHQKTFNGNPLSPQWSGDNPKSFAGSDFEGLSSKLLPQEDFCKMICKFHIQSIHGCVRFHEMDETSSLASIPFEILSKYHSKSFPKQVTIVSITNENLKLKFIAKTNDLPSVEHSSGSDKSVNLGNLHHYAVGNNIFSTVKSIQKGSGSIYLGDISIYCTPTSPGILFKVVNVWIDNITSLTSVISRYQELWSRRMQVLIGELLRSKSKSLNQSFDNREKLMLEFISPEFKEIIGDEAIIHRLGWEDISKMRHYLLDYPDRNVLNQIVGQVNLESEHDSFTSWQELINEIYELDQDGELIQIFQSSLIKQLFIPEPGTNSIADFDMNFLMEGIQITVVSTETPKTSNNQLAIGKVSGGAFSNYLFDASPSTSLVTSTESHTITTTNGGGNKYIPPSKTLIDINFFSNCNQVSLKVSPDLILFVNNTIQVINATDVDVLRSEELILGYHDPWKEAIKPSGSRDGMISPGSNHSRSNSVNNSPPKTPPQVSEQSSPNLTSTSKKSKHSKIESSPNLSSITKKAKEKEKEKEKIPTLNINGEDPTTIPKKKKKTLENNQIKNNTVISVHGHFSFQEIHCKALSSNNGSMQMLLKDMTFVFTEFGKETLSKKKTQEGSRPNGEYIQMIHSCFFSVPLIELHLLDQIDTKKPIFGLSIKDLMFNEVLFKTGKKKSRQISSGKREEYIDFDMKYDLFLTFSKLILPFKMSHQFLPKLRGFLKDWTPPEKPNTTSANPPLKGSGPLKLFDFPPLRIKLDLHDIMISTDAIQSLPVKYNISRITCSISQFSKLELEFNICIHQHQILFSAKPSSSSSNAHSKESFTALSKEPINFPRIKSFGSIKNNLVKDKINLTANLEIGFIQNCITIELLQNLLVLRTTLQKEFDDLLNAYINFAEKKGNTGSNSSVSLNSNLTNTSTSSNSLLSKVNYNCSLILKGFEVLFINNSASLLFSSGVLDLRVLYKNILNSPSQEPIQWKVGLRGLTAILSDPSLTLDKSEQSIHGYTRIQNLKSQIWAGVLTDIALQSYPFIKQSKKSASIVPSTSSSSHRANLNANQPYPIALSSKSTKPNLFEKAWVNISRTIITIQPWAIDKATDLWIFYFTAYQKTVAKLSKIPSFQKKQVKRALGTIPSTVPIKETNMSLHINLTETSLCIPFLLYDEGHTGGADPYEKNTPKNIESCSALVISLNNFSLDGSTIKDKSMDSKKAGKTNSFKVIGNCKFLKFSFQFIDNYHPSKLHALHVLPTVNRGVLDSGDCQMIGLFSSHHVQLLIQLKTSGLFLHLDTNLLYYIISFQNLLFLGQEKLKKINEEQSKNNTSSHNNNNNNNNNNNSSIDTSEIPEYKLEIDFSLKTSVGECRLTKQQLFDDNLSVFETSTPPISSSFDRNQSSSSLGQKENEQFQECFQLPPLAISANHIFIPIISKDSKQENNNLSSSASDDRKSKSETNILLILESQEIRLSPFFTNFLHELLENAPDSILHQAANQNSTSGNKLLLNDKSPSGTTGTIKTTPGSTTFSVRINPTKIILHGGLYDQILSILEIGTLDIFLSSITKNTSNSNKRVILMNGTLNLTSALFKTIHLSHNEERLGLVIRGVTANVGTAHGLTQDGPLISILCNVDRSNFYFNAKYLDEALLFIRSWIPNSAQSPSAQRKNTASSISSYNKNLLDQPIVVLSPPPSPYLKNHPTAVQDDQQLSTTKKSPQFYVYLKLNSFALDLDLLPVSRFNLLIYNICGVFSPIDDENHSQQTVPQQSVSLKSKQLPITKASLKPTISSPTPPTSTAANNNLYFLSFYTGSVSASCHGKLDGNFELDGVILCGERIPYKGVNTIDMWTLQISPIRISFDYNQSEILELKCGDIISRFSNLPIENSFSGNRNINFDINFTLLQLQLSCETITSILEIVKRINEMISEKIQIAKTNYKKYGGLDFTHPKSLSPSATATNIAAASAAKKPAPKLVVGQIKVRGSQFKILLFGYSMRDPTWISFSLDSYQLTLDQSRKRNDEIHRQLSILLGQSTISKMAEEGSSPNKHSWALRDPFDRPSLEVKIIKIPVASLIMYSTERSRSIEYYYLTEFTDSIAISVNLNLYADLREMVQIYIKALSDDTQTKTPIVSSPSGSAASSPPLAPINNNNNNNPGISLTESHSSISLNDDTLQGLKTRKDIKTNRIFIEKRFNLSPTLNVLGDLTPKITTVFGWLGIKDINYTIPFYTHVGLTDNLETILNSILLFSVALNKTNNNNSNSTTNNNNNKESGK